MIYEVLIEGSSQDALKYVSSPIELRRGTRIFVFDGREKRTAYVVGESSERASLTFAGVLDDFISEKRFEVYKWLSENYGSSLSSLLSLSYPSGLENYMEVYIKPSSELVDFPVMREEEFLEKYGISQYRKLLSQGLASLEVRWNFPKVQVKREENYVLSMDLSEILSLNLSHDELRIVQKFMERGILTYAELEKEFLKKHIFSLVRKGVIKSGVQKRAVKLRPDQERAAKNLKNGVNLVQGQTGSGKTEAYIKAMEGREALYLVPEVSLVPQVIRRIKERLGNVEVGVYHSYMSRSRRIFEWLRAVSGKVDVLVGTRSAIFVPVDWQIIIVDEFHDESFYQRDGVVYDAVEFVKKFADVYEMPVILGSATPRVEEFYDESFKHFYIKRVFPPPKVITVDLREEKRKGSFAQKTLEFMDKALSMRKKVMVFVRRKGFGRVMCRRCGYVVKCDLCDVALTYHKNKGIFKCHVCGKEVEAFGICPVCGGELTLYGTGTERVENELAKFFPEKKISRVDREVLSKPDSLIGVLDRFSRGEIDVLIGTKMISKGIDVKGVGLMVVVDLDGMLSMPDFSARFRTFQLLVQSVGRSGREGGGYAVIQHYGMDEEILKFVVEGDLEGFYKSELERRKLFRYPPFGHVIHVLYSASRKEMAENMVFSVASKLKAEEILGPSEYLIPRIKGKYTYHFILKTNEVRKSLNALTNTISKFDRRGWKIFVDPPSLYYI